MTALVKAPHPTSESVMNLDDWWDLAVDRKIRDLSPSLSLSSLLSPIINESLRTAYKDLHTDSKDR